MTSSFSSCCVLLLAFVAAAGHVSGRELRQDLPEPMEDGASSGLENADMFLPRKLAISRTAWCRAWMTNVEMGNIRSFSNTPVDCYPTIKKYIEKGQYLIDLSVSTSEMWKYLSTIKPDGVSDAIMFDIDETLISTAKIQATFNYGTLPFNVTYYNIQQDTLILAALSPSLELYRNLQAAGWKLILITGRKEVSRAHTAENLRAVGYNTWDELILKTDEYHGLTAAVYKSLARVKLQQENGYDFRSCAGDQASDCTGDATGPRTWKFPNPMYYAA